MEKKEISLKEIQHKPPTFKIIIPAEVERKIRIFCNNIWEEEWSGVLFYKVQGTFEDESLIITCLDILLRDIGNVTSTEFNVDFIIPEYMAAHPELLKAGVYQGLIHSHNNMNTFFSSTDIKTLTSEAREMPHFVSLIVNNRGTYTAGITRRCANIYKTKKEYTYPTWEGNTQSGSLDSITEEEVLEWYDLIPIIEGPQDEEEALSAIKALREAREQKKSSGIFTNNSRYLDHGGWGHFDHTYSIDLEKKSKVAVTEDTPKYYNCIDKTPTKVKLETIKEDELPFEEIEQDIPYRKVTINPDIIQSLIKQIVTSSIIISNESAVDVNKWATSMDSLYKKRFNTIQMFENFAANYIDFLLTSTEDDEALNRLGENEDALVAILAYDLKQELIKLPKNPWICTYINVLEDYII